MIARADRAVLLALAGASLAAGASSPAAAQPVSRTFESAAGARRYQLYLPRGYDAARRYPLVVLLHGCTQDAADLARGTRIAEHVEREDVIAVLPEQPEGANPKKCWNWYDPAHQARDAGEPAIIAGITDAVIRGHAVDPARVHLGGMSAGAAMASLVAVAYPERYASVALHSGLVWRTATTVTAALAAMAKGVEDADSVGVAALAAMGAWRRPVPALVIHGGKDAVVNAANGRQAARQWAVTNARALGAALADARISKGETNGFAWTRECHMAGGVCVVEEWLVPELGHAWSGGSREGTYTDERGPDATREMLRFFREHPMPPHR